MDDRIKIIGIVGGLIVVAIAIAGCINGEKEVRLDQENPKTTNSTVVYIYGNHQYAQSFIPTTDTLTHIELYCGENVNPPNNLTVSIRENLTGPDIAIVEVPPGGLPPGYQWVEFDFEPNITVIPGKTYYIVCRTEGGDIPNSYSWEYVYTPANPYPSGSFFESTDAGLTWIEYPEADFCFKSYGLY